MCAPLVVFVYKRIEHMRQTLEALNANTLSDRTDIYIYSDAASNEADELKVQEVRDYLESFSKNSKFKSVHLELAKQHKGLADSIINGVTQIMKKYGKAIIVEDDVITNRYFLQFMNDALNYYKDERSVWSIAGASYLLDSLKNYDESVYLFYRGESHAWASWANRWETIDWNVSDYAEFVKDRKRIKKFERGGTDLPRLLRLQRQGKIDSWAIRWDYQQSKSDSMTIYPVKSLIKNIGYDGSGSHCVKDEKMECDMGQEEFEYHLKVPNLSADILKEFKAFYHVPMWKRIVLKLQSYLKVKR